MSTGKVVGSHDQYRIEDAIAKGAFSVVYRCVDLRTGGVHAIKVINKKLAERQRMTEALIREVNAMEVAGQSPYVIHLVDKLVSKHNYYIVMELAQGGTLLDVIRERRGSGYYGWIAPFFKQLLTGIADMHGSNVVHRDIKPENILFNKAKTRLLISDFGFACYSPDDHELHRACGTLRYCAPELLVESPRYEGRKVDVWAAGVTLYVMFCGTHPFPARAGVDPDTLLETIQTTTIHYPRHIPSLARDLMSHMLNVDPKERWSAEQLLEHPWMRETSARLPGDNNNDSIGSATSPKYLSGSRAQSTAGTYAASPINADSMGPGMARTPDDHDFTPLPTVLSLDNIDDGFYVQHSDRSGGEESFERIGNSESDADRDDAFFAINGTSASCSYRESQGGMGNRSTSSQCSGGVPGAGRSGAGGVPVGTSPGSSSLGLPSRRHPPTASNAGAGHGTDEVNYDVVFEGLFVRPRMYLRGIYLTVITICRFVSFCIALLFATALRVVFDMDIAELPLPTPVLRVLADLVVPPQERKQRHRHAVQQQQQGARETGKQGAHASPPPLQEGGLLKGTHVSGRTGGGAGAEVSGLSSPSPGSKIRHYVREAERRLNSSLAYAPSDLPSRADYRLTKSPAQSGLTRTPSEPRSTTPTTAFREESDLGSSEGRRGGQPTSQEGKGLRQRNRPGAATPHHLPDSLHGLSLQLPGSTPTGPAALAQASSSVLSPYAMLSLCSPPQDNLSTTLRPMHTPVTPASTESASTVRGCSATTPATSATARPPAKMNSTNTLKGEHKDGQNGSTTFSVNGCKASGTKGEDEEEDGATSSGAAKPAAFSPSVPFRSWPGENELRRLKTEDFPTPPAAPAVPPVVESD